MKLENNMKGEQINVFEKILEEFTCLPKIGIESTYLEICKYPNNRFEEVCSRILCFFFDPKNEHNLNDLFLESLFNLITPNKNIYYKNNQVEVIPELDCEKKRLDIFIKSPDFVIGIENKIKASIYNRLDLYSQQIDQYSNNNSFKIILSVKKIVSEKEKEWIYKNGFTIVYYSDFFEILKLNIGRYISQANHKYLIYLYDFIQTIENMTEEMPNNNELYQFLSTNSKNIEELTNLYNKYQQRIFNIRKDRINELLKNIKDSTGDNEWKILHDWNLVYDRFNNGTNKPEIRIEASYQNKNNNPLGEFRIYISTKKIKDYSFYEDILKEKYHNNFLDKTKENRAFLHLDIIENDNENEILQKLQEPYNLLYDIVKDQILLG